MIKGLYEAYLPVRDIERSIEFHNKLGLELAYKNELVTFFWLEKGKSWLGLWPCEQVNIPCPASIRHVAFQ
ncbi:VOC family protein [Paenibacillus larvae]